MRAEAAVSARLNARALALVWGKRFASTLRWRPGQQTQTVVVTGTPPIINTTSAVISTTIESKTINDLPLSGRLYTKLLDYTPGVAGRPGGNTPTYSSNGAGTMANMWMLDGVDDVNQFAASGPLFGATTSGDELTDAAAGLRFRKSTSCANPKAEFGWEQGAVVNVGLKSGTNTLHGSAYAYGRYTPWDANSPYLRAACQKPSMNSARSVGPSADISSRTSCFILEITRDSAIRSAHRAFCRSQVRSRWVGSRQQFPGCYRGSQGTRRSAQSVELESRGLHRRGVCDPRKGIFTNGTRQPTAVLGHGQPSGILTTRSKRWIITPTTGTTSVVFFFSATPPIPPLERACSPIGLTQSNRVMVVVESGCTYPIPAW